MGYKLNEENESYVYKQCCQLNIDPKVLEKQLIEIKRLKLLADNRQKFIDWVFEHHPDVAKEYLG